MIKRHLGWVMGAALVMAMPVVQAASPSNVMKQPSWTKPIMPDRGMYYTPGHGGTGLNVDVDPSGYVFAIFYTYDASGKPYYYLMEGDFQPNIDLDASEGHIGTFDATPYISENGECVGPSCVYKNPDRTATDLHAHIDWTTPRHATVTIGTQTWDVWAGSYRVPDVDRFVGTWAVSWQGVFDEGGSQTQSNVTALIDVAKTNYSVSQVGAGTPTTVLPPDGSVIYSLTCATDESGGQMDQGCADFYSLVTWGFDASELFAWYEPATGMFMVSPGVSIFGGSSITLYNLVDPKFVHTIPDYRALYRAYLSGDGDVVRGIGIYGWTLTFSRAADGATAYHPDN